MTRTMLGTPFQPAPGLLVISPSRLRDFHGCRQRFHLTHVMGLRHLGADEAVTGHGLQVHAELHARHVDMEQHDHAGPLLAETPDIVPVRRAVAAHSQLCPAGTATYLGGELDLRWYLPGKALLVTGRVDALWRYPDGTLEIRHYKTGSVPEGLEEDPGALLYAVLAAAQQPERTPVRVVYERLGSEHPGLITLEATDELLRRAYESVLDLAEAMRRERAFPASPLGSRCRHCPFARSCPEAAAPE